MANISQVYRFDRELAKQILKTAHSRRESGGISTSEMIEMDPFSDYPYEALVANCLYLWNDACIYVQSDDVDEGPLRGNKDYRILGLTGIGEDRLRRFKNPQE